MAKINKEEYQVLKNYNHIGVKWISRNENGNLVISKVNPDKIRGKWLPNCPDEDWSELRNSHNNLFHFIQLEDDEPYNIAELIKEYEFGKILLAMAKEETVLELECESEEREMKKNIEWLKREFDSLFNGKSILTVGKSVIDDILNQLDEPEVLSLDWIDDNKKDSGVHYIGYYVPIGRLHDLLVPKQEEMTKEELEKYGMSESRWKKIIERYKWHLEHEGYVVTQKPIIPEFVFEDIKGYKDADMVEIGELFSDIFDEKRMTTNLYRTSEWAINNQVEFAKAWLAYPNIEVEEEQKYYISERDEEYGGFWFLSKNNNGDISIGVNRDWSEVDWDRLKLTEQEIKDYDGRYWPFRKPVEEMEE